MTVRLRAVGDISFGRGVDRVVRETGASQLFAGVLDWLRGADILFGNLETPLSTRGTCEARPPQKLLDGRMNYFIPLRGVPEAAAALREAGFHLVSLANNHMMDYGAIALADTLAALDQQGVEYVGAGRTREEAERPVYLERNGLRIAFLAFSVSGVEATASQPGVAWAREERIIPAIAAARRNAEAVVVSLHWGADGERYPYPWQQRLAMEVVEAGASLIVGHHPHVIQGYEVRNQSLITYSLGNFIFDAIDGEWGEGLILDCGLSREGVKEFGFIAVHINTIFQPRVLEGDAKHEVLRRLALLSETLADVNHPIWLEMRRKQELDDASGIYLILRGGWIQLLSRLHRVRPRHVPAIWQALKALARQLTKRMV